MFPMDVLRECFYVGVFGRADPAPTVDVTRTNMKTGGHIGPPLRFMAPITKKTYGHPLWVPPDNIHP